MSKMIDKWNITEHLTLGKKHLITNYLCMGEQVNVQKGNTALNLDIVRVGRKKRPNWVLLPLSLRIFFFLIYIYITTNQLTFRLSIYVEEMLSNFSFEYSWHTMLHQFQVHNLVIGHMYPLCYIQSQMSLPSVPIHLYYNKFKGGFWFWQFRAMK